MINLFEASTVKASHHFTLASGFVAALALGAVSPLDAQGTRVSRDPKSDAILVATFCTPPNSSPAVKKLGAEAGEALRARLPKDIPLKQLWVIPTGDIKANLEPAGFKYEDCLSTNDARLLSQSFRADEFVEGRVTNVGGNIRVAARMVLTNDAKMSQPLPPVEAKRVDHAMTQVAQHLKAARAQLPAERRCEGFVRERKFAEAAAAARQAIAAYPQSTLGRICLASAFSGLNYSPDSILPVVTEVLQIDSLNYHGLALAAGAHKAKGDSAKATELLVRLLSTDPTNVNLQISVANDIAASRNFDAARKIIKEALEANPGDPDLIRLNFQIMVATEDWKEAAKAGEELIRTDTSATDTLFFPRLAAAYKADSQPQKAAEAIARGLNKYPNNARFHLLHSQFLREAGQLPQSIVAARRALEINPNMPEAIIAYLTIAQTHLDLNQTDSIGPVLRIAAAAAKTGQDSTRVASFALQQGQIEFNKAKADTATANAVVAREGYEKSIRWFALGDSLAPSASAKFQQGYAAYLTAVSISQKEITPNAKTLTPEAMCTLGRLGQQYANMAMLSIQRGGGVANPEAGGQIMNGAMGMGEYWNAVIKQGCKTESSTAARPKTARPKSPR
jgi:tetratricopeptide (TPR) repeat protein